MEQKKKINLLVSCEASGNLLIDNQTETKDQGTCTQKNQNTDRNIQKCFETGFLDLGDRLCGT